MKVDLDKYRKFLASHGASMIDLAGRLVNPNLLPKLGLRQPTSSAAVFVWSLTFGVEYGERRVFHDVSAHGALTRAIKFLKKAKPRVLEALGARRPRKANSFARKAKPKKRTKEE